MKGSEQKQFGHRGEGWSELSVVPEAHAPGLPRATVRGQSHLRGPQGRAPLCLCVCCCGAAIVRRVLLHQGIAGVSCRRCSVLVGCQSSKGSPFEAGLTQRLLRNYAVDLVSRLEGVDAADAVTVVTAR